MPTIKWPLLVPAGDFPAAVFRVAFRAAGFPVRVSLAEAFPVARRFLGPRCHLCILTPAHFPSHQVRGPWVSRLARHRREHRRRAPFDLAATGHLPGRRVSVGRALILQGPEVQPCTVPVRRAVFRQGPVLWLTQAHV